MNLAALFRPRPRIGAPVAVAVAHPVAPVPVLPAAAQPKTGSRLRRKAAVALLCSTTFGGFEGVRQTAYPDPATGREPWTVCYGETEGVQRGDHYTLQQCRDMLTRSLEKYALRLEGCVTRPMPDTTYAAFLSLSYNIGSGGFCKSTVARQWNAGNSAVACNAMLRFNKAAGTGPTSRAMTSLTGWALRTAQGLLAGVGESDLAYEVGLVIARRERSEAEAGRRTWEAMEAAVKAKLDADAAQGRDSWAALDARAEARRAAKAARAA